MWITTTKRGPPLRQGNGSTAMTSTTMFVNIEEGGPVLIAIDSSIPLNSAPTVDIELIH